MRKISSALAGAFLILASAVSAKESLVLAVEPVTAGCASPTYDAENQYVNNRATMAADWSGAEIYWVEYLDSGLPPNKATEVIHDSPRKKGFWGKETYYEMTFSYSWVEIFSHSETNTSSESKSGSLQMERTNTISKTEDVAFRARIGEFGFDFPGEIATESSYGLTITMNYIIPPMEALTYILYQQIANVTIYKVTVPKKSKQSRKIINELKIPLSSTGSREIRFRPNQEKINKE